MCRLDALIKDSLELKIIRRCAKHDVPATVKTIKWEKPNFQEEIGEYFENEATKNWLAKKGISFESENELIEILSNGHSQIITKEHLIHYSVNLTLTEDEFSTELKDTNYSESFFKIEKELKEKKSITLESPILLKIDNYFYGFSGNRRVNIAFKYKIPIKFWVVVLKDKSTKTKES